MIARTGSCSDVRTSELVDVAWRKNAEAQNSIMVMERPLGNSPYATQLMDRRSSWHATLTPLGHSLRRSVCREERRAEPDDAVCAAGPTARRAAPAPLQLIPPPPHVLVANMVLPS